MKKISALRFRYLLNVCCLAFVGLAFVTPNRLNNIEWTNLLAIPLEALILGLVLLIPNKSGQVMRWIAATLLALGIILKLADIATYPIFGRAFNPLLDAFFFANGMNLLHGAIGQLGALLVAFALVALVLGFIILAFFILAKIKIELCLSPKSSLAILISGLIVWIALFACGLPGASKIFYEQISEHIQASYHSYAELEQFRKEVVIDSVVTETAPSNLFSKLKGKDILLIFIESYGRTVLDKPEFSDYMRPVLQQATSDLNDKNINARSAYLTSSTMGGLSWLAHGTALSGLWIDSQARYDSLIMSQRPSLNRLFKNAGWRTSAIEPAITMAWPEGKYFGYDQIYAAADLGYKGKSFNWVTMPDQFTLSAYQSLERQPGHLPVMTEMALISSHAPWTPIPYLVDWNAVGDGTIFNSQATSGESPEIVWQDNEKIRVQYRRSIEYALKNLVSFAIHYGDDNLVILAFGDHQPAPLVTGDSDNRDVIVHLISRDPKVMEAVSDWQWTPGMLPAVNAPVWRMDELRPHLIESFSEKQSTPQNLISINH
jgi:hypothetical protein